MHLQNSKVWYHTTTTSCTRVKLLSLAAAFTTKWQIIRRTRGQSTIFHRGVVGQIKRNAKTAETDHWKTWCQRILLSAKSRGCACHKMQTSSSSACAESCTINGIEYEVTWSNPGAGGLSATGRTKRIISLVFVQNMGNLATCILRSPMAHRFLKSCKIEYKWREPGSQSRIWALVADELKHYYGNFKHTRTVSIPVFHPHADGF